MKKLAILLTLALAGCGNPDKTYYNWSIWYQQYHECILNMPMMDSSYRVDNYTSNCAQNAYLAARNK